MCNSQRPVIFGITTGTCAAGAAKAAAIYELTGKIPDYVIIKNLDGLEFKLKTFRYNNNFFGVQKFSGDDKCDITDGIKILAHVEILRDNNQEIFFTAGEGVGVVTLPGLKIPPGEPAINPVPRKMIELAIREIIPLNSVKIIISIPGGEEIAQKTFNPRLGIKGGLSILGTSGLVKPMNERALMDSLTLELNMIRALGFDKIYITFANSGEKAARKIFDIHGKNIIQSGNYIGHVLDESARLNFTHAIICGHPGKLLKVAAGSFNTHNKISDGRLESLCTHLALMGASQEIISRIYHSNTTNEAINIISESGYNKVWHNIAEIIKQKCESRINNKFKVDAYFIDNDGRLL